MSIKLSAYNGDKEPTRIERLNDVAEAITEKKHITKVVALHDHKGTLHVNFSGRPMTSDIVAISRIWSGHAEWAMNIYHQAIPVCVDTLGDNPFGGPDS